MTTVSLARLLDGTDSGVFVLSPAIASARVSDLRHRRGLQGFDVHCAGARDKDSVLQAFARDLRLPEWFGGNWDALADCLMDMEAISKGPGAVVMVTGLEGLAQHAPEDYEMLMGVLRDAVTYWQEEGVLFCVLLEGRRDVLGSDLPEVTVDGTPA